MRLSLRCLGVVCVLTLPLITLAAPPTRAVVPGFERFKEAEKADPVRGGFLLLGELGCVGCHADTTAVRRPGPDLDHVGARVRISHLRKFLRDPHAVKPGTTMPALFAGEKDRDQKVEALVHFLAATGSFRQERPDPRVVSSGRDLYHKVGCVACHGTRDASGKEDKVLPTSVPLGDLKAKYSTLTLAAFLDKPHEARPSSRMPKLLTGKEPRDVANYLLQGIKYDLPAGKGATKYAYYEGDWNNLPDFDKLKPKATGTAPGFDLGVAKRNGSFGVTFEGYFKTDRDGEHSFTLNSDDGSRLYIDDRMVVNNDGTHPPQSVPGKARLAKGVHKVKVLFFQGGGGAELSVTIASPGVGDQDLGGLVADSPEALEKKTVVKPPPDEDSLDIEPAMVEKGRALFTSTGCANCHQMTDGKKAIASTLLAPDRKKLRPEGGCLSADPTKTPVRFALDDMQRKALILALKNDPDPDKSPAGIIAQTMTTFNCYACHSRDKVGGPEEDANKLFLTTQPEMGDEGRIPPPLDGVGAKLNPEYLRQLLDKGGHDRPYMHTRMPGYGLSHVGPIADAFAALDKVPKAVEVKFKEPLPRIKATARHMMGNEAFGCIKCHTFAGHKAEGVQGMDMVLLTKRLRHDWFRAYVNDPQSFRPGTRMPSAFMDGKSILPKILDGTANTQIEAMWVYLLDGNNARVPIGTNKQSIPLVPTDGAIIYRNFIEGVGTRAIGVGFPEKANLAFDANEMRLAMIWHGGFIDAARHWNDRGAGFEGPLGDNVLALPSGVPFADLAGPDDAWPARKAKEQGYRFQGYRLTPDDRPTFLYSLGDVKVEDFSTPTTGKEVTLRRKLTLTAKTPGETLHLRAAVGTKVEPIDGGYRIDGFWRVKVQGGAARIRQSGGKSELLVPIRFTDGKAEVVLEYAW